MQAFQRFNRLPRSNLPRFLHKPRICVSIRFYSDKISPPKPVALQSAQSRLGRVKVHLSYFLMGTSPRSFKLDDILALISWFLFSHTLFVLLFTTTFFSLLIFVLKSLDFDDYLVRKVSNVLTNETGMKISFENASPTWSKGVIRLSNLRIQLNPDTWMEYLKSLGKNFEEIDMNWSYWDVTIQNVDITLSLWRYLQGHGLLLEAHIKGIRGNLDRRHVFWPDDWEPTPRPYRPGDFELERFSIDDLSLRVREKDYEYDVSVFHADSKCFRKQYLLKDWMQSDVVGLFDGCLFSIHRPLGVSEDEKKVFIVLLILLDNSIVPYKMCKYSPSSFQQWDQRSGRMAGCSRRYRHHLLNTQYP